MAKIINLTPHVINLHAADGALIESIPSAGVARVATIPGELADVGLSVPVAEETIWGEIEGLPAPQDGVFYVVSMFVAQRARRPDVLSPGTGPNDGVIRKDGVIVGVTRLIRHV